MVKIRFIGGTHEVGRNAVLLQSKEANLLLDYGVKIGEKPEFPGHVRSRDVDGIILSHAHLDHIGYLPRLVKNGFGGRVYCTPATREIAELILYDSAKNQERDAEYANRKGITKHTPALPLYDSQDVERTLRLFQTVTRDEYFSPATPIQMRFHDAGHLLGSNMIEAEIRAGEKPIRFLFSGDLGRYDGPLYYDPAPPPAW